MEDYYAQGYAQRDSQGQAKDESMTGLSPEEDFYNDQVHRHQASTGMQTHSVSGPDDMSLARQNSANSGQTESVGGGAGGTGNGMHPSQQMSSGFSSNNMAGFEMGNNSNGSGGVNIGQNPMVPNAMQQQASLNFMTQMMNTNPMYAMMMSNAVAAANVTSASQQPNNGIGMNSSPNMIHQSPIAASPQDQNATNPMFMMPGAQMMTGMMMNPMMQNMPKPSQIEGVSQNDGSRGNNALSNGDTSTNPFNHTNHVDMAEQTPRNSYQAMSRQNSVSYSRRPSLTQQASRRNSVQFNPTHQSPTAYSFSNSMPSQVPPLVPVVQNSFPEAGGVGPAFATSGTQLSSDQENYRNAYSSTGFDMLTVLMRVATRKRPMINIGNVDLSCAFVVCDTMEHDIPIVYCSENFERLTGYTKHEILGRNCRFLQAPSGHVQAGVKRNYVDDDVVLHLKNAINSRAEAQVSVINYRKGGQPFMNLLTLIPIPYDTDEIKYYVGFQVDLVEQPHSITKKNANGTYAINYQRGLQLPRYIFTGQDRQRSTIDSGQTVPRDEVSTVLSTIGTGESELSKRIWDKVLLENTDDVIFVLSLKGLFLYLSPSCNKVLEYDPNELMGAALSSVCHPSDIVPVTRELKDTTTGAVVSVVFRIRRKENGYMWFEGRGSLSVEQGKGRKSIVLVGREKPVYTLKRTDLMVNGGVGENEVWTKISTSGMFLYVSSSIRALLDKQPSELVGTSIQALMRPDSRSDFGRILEIARSGKRAQTRHELINRRGQVLQAFSTVYPGDAMEGSKPTFFVAQTRLLKYIRPTPATNSQRPTPNQPNSPTNPKSTSSAVAPNRNAGPSRSVSSTGSLASPSQYMSTFETAATYAGGDSLPLGHQDAALADDLNLFDELKTTRSTSWQYELRQMEKRNRLLAEELQGLLAAKKKRKRRKPGAVEKECANCHTKQTPEWRRGPSGNRDLCNSCGLRWAKQQGRISPRTTSHRSGASVNSDQQSDSPRAAQDQANVQQRPMSASASTITGEKERSGSGGPSGRESRSIEETLAQSTPQQQQQQNHSQLPAAAGQSIVMPPVSKAAKLKDSNISPAKQSSFGASIPTKIEEEE